jgi:hypothetical protein
VQAACTVLNSPTSLKPDEATNTRTPTVESSGSEGETRMKSNTSAGAPPADLMLVIVRIIMHHAYRTEDDQQREEEGSLSFSSSSSPAWGLCMFS